MAKIRILPVYPEFPLTFWSFKSAMEYTGKKSIMPPTGLATVLAMVPEDNFEIQRIVDLNVEPLTDRAIESANVVFTSTMVVQEDSHNEVIGRAHRLGKKVVAGGPFPTSYPERNSNADFIVAGEAELTLEPFLGDFLKGNARRIYTEENVGAKGKPSLTETPLPRWDLVKLDEYSCPSAQYSRGCPFNCEFCDITQLFGRVPRTKTNEQMLQELDYLYNLGHRGSVFILDDNFIGNAKNVRGLLPDVISWQKQKKYPFRFFTEASVNLAWDENRDILENMIEAGFNECFLGIETPDTDSLKKMGKSQNTKIPPLDAVRVIQEAGMEVTAGFIVGSDGDKPSIFEDLFNFIQAAGIVVPMPGLLTAVKGTDLYKRLISEGRILSESNGNNTHHAGFNFKTKLNEDFLVRGYTDLLSKLFAPENYYERCRKLQESLGESDISGRTLKHGEVSAAIKSLLRQPFKKGGTEYLKYLAYTLVNHPRRLPLAFAHTIKFDHFQKITQATIEVHDYKAHTESLYQRFGHSLENIYHHYLPHQDSRDVGAIKKAEDKIKSSAARIIHGAEARFSRLHKDFRADAGEALEKLKLKVYREVDKFKSKYFTA